MSTPRFCMLSSTTIGLHSGHNQANWDMASVKRAAAAVAAILVREGVDYAQSKPTAVLGKARTVAPDAARVGRAWLGRQMVLDPDLVPPRIVQVVLVGKPGALAQPQRRLG